MGGRKTGTCKHCKYPIQKHAGGTVWLHMDNISQCPGKGTSKAEPADPAVISRVDRAVQAIKDAGINLQPWQEVALRRLVEADVDARPTP